MLHKTESGFHENPVDNQSDRRQGLEVCTPAGKGVIVNLLRRIVTENEMIKEIKKQFSEFGLMFTFYHLKQFFFHAKLA